MSEIIDLYGPLPPGWESRYDTKSRKHYYVDNYNRTTTWEDPRPRYRALLNQSSRQGSPSHSSIGTNEMIPLQHGSLELRGSSTVYPSYASYPPPPQPAFQLPPTPFSHLAPGSSLYQEFGSGRPSPVMGRTLLASSAFQRAQPVSDAAASTDDMAAKINATFPTASETHIRLLLKKYHNREAVVMSALQVEKHPLATPGPFSTPPLARNLHLTGAYTPIQMTPPLSMRGTPPIGIAGGSVARGSPPIATAGGSLARGSPPTRASSAASSYYGSPRFGDYSQSHRPQHSPKMKLRYLKNVFPKAEETLLLDVLSGEDNNVNRATERLKAMGFDRRDAPHAPPPASSAPPSRHEDEYVRPAPPPRMKSLEEKARMRGRLQGLYGDVPERLIQIAMESADFDEEKARQILLAVTDEKENQPVTETGLVTGGSGADLTDGVTLHVEPSTSTAKSPRHVKATTKATDVKATTKATDVNASVATTKAPKTGAPKVSRGTSPAAGQDFRSPYLTQAQGRNPAIRHGPNDKLLLVEYVTWSGPNGDLRAPKAAGLAKGPNPAALSGQRYLAKGPNSDLRRGPALGLAKGSIYSQLAQHAEARGQ